MNTTDASTNNNAIRSAEQLATDALFRAADEARDRAIKALEKVSSREETVKAFVKAATAPEREELRNARKARKERLSALVAEYRARLAR